MLVDQKADDKTCDWIAKDDYRIFFGEVGADGGRAADKTLGAGDVITQYH